MILLMSQRKSVKLRGAIVADPKIGKIDEETFTTFLLSRLGKRDDTVIVPPKTGVDAAVIDIGNDKVLVIAEDPIFAIPHQPLDMFGWYTVHILSLIHISEPTRLLSISYAVFCLKKKKKIPYTD